MVDTHPSHTPTAEGILTSFDQRIGRIEAEIIRSQTTLQNTVASLRAEIAGERPQRPHRAAGDVNDSFVIPSIPAALLPAKPTYSGSIKGLEEFIYLMDNYLAALNSFLVNVPESRVDAINLAIVLGQLTGAAATFARSFLCADVETVQELYDKLRGRYPSDSRQDAARRKLEGIRMKEKTNIHTHNENFINALNECVGVDEPQAIWHYKESLIPVVQGHVSFAHPTTLAGAMTTAVQAYDAFVAPRHKRDNHMPRTSQTPYNTYSQSTSTGPTPMELGAMHIETRVCYNCGRPGHIAAKCKAPKRTGFGGRGRGGRGGRGGKGGTGRGNQGNTDDQRETSEPKN